MTYSLLLTDHRRRWLAIASATCTPAVGATVPAARATIGGVVSQAHTNSALRVVALDLLATGASSESAVSGALAQDDQPELRQVGVLDAHGVAAHHTGADVTPWSGAIARPGMLALGNLLTGPEVLIAMAAAADLENAREPLDRDGLARRALESLRAGQRAGGDRRGQQSASLLVVSLTSDDSDAQQVLDVRADDDPHPLDLLEDLLEDRRQGA